MKPLIEIKQEYLIECDNYKCDFKVPNIGNDTSLEAGKEYVNMPCPKCGWNLLTEKDYNDTASMLRTVRWVNRWFSWLRWFSTKKEKETLYAKVQDGIKLKRE